MQQKDTLSVLALALSCVLAAGAAQAALIDFETIPGAAPVDGLAIGDQFLGTAGVSFQLEGGGLPLLTEVGGNPTTAFAPNDTPDEAARHGSFFLSDEDRNPFDDLEVSTLIVSYSTPSMLVSLELVDIDFDEAIRVEALDASDQLLDFIVVCNRNTSASCTTLGGETDALATGNGVTTAFSFDRAQADIDSLRIISERNSSGGFGLAFDNFETGVVPEPGTGLLLAAGLAQLARRRRAQRFGGAAPRA